MKKFFAIILLTVLFSTTAIAQNRGFGAGVILGNPTGVSLKAWQSQTTAIDAAIAWNFGKYDALIIHADYLWHNFSLINVEKGKLPLYYGIGASGVFTSDFGLAVRGVVGLDYMFATVPIDIFLEIVPALLIIPSSDFSVDAGIGVRYFF